MGCLSFVHEGQRVLPRLLCTVERKGLFARKMLDLNDVFLILEYFREETLGYKQILNRRRGLEFEQVPPHRLIPDDLFAASNEPSR